MVACLALGAGIGLLVGDINGASLRGLALGLIIGALSAYFIGVSPVAFAAFASVCALLTAAVIIHSLLIFALAFAASVVIAIAALRVTAAPRRGPGTTTI
ncbi:hypothetical protein GOARA_042_00240 [Gordonia araii NBRC 100433]|uniref:Uncharacterized protein n=1 Tax=Gordonia araii NBRC 100433 TaxID=1073574 RepID=G7H0Z2_9ACTN|nr:hypothetical protein [Gordonia araii]NNG97310.1 hypothetical protein [Gordonia araii NBRC 100433]GAB09517.1 hypothetical protein GOARA_042_00240 [Gordonia araii NBRC 100433]